MDSVPKPEYMAAKIRQTSNRWPRKKNIRLRYSEQSIYPSFFMGGEQGLNYTFVNCLMEDSAGRIWIGMNGGINIWDGNGLTSITTENGLNANTVLALYEDRTDRFWIGTARGLNLSQGTGRVF